MFHVKYELYINSEIGHDMFIYLLFKGFEWLKCKVSIDSHLYRGKTLGRIHYLEECKTNLQFKAKLLFNKQCRFRYVRYVHIGNSYVNLMKLWSR